MDRAEKHAFVADMNAVFKETAAVIVTHYSGLNVAQVTDLRRRMRDGGARFRVTKNRLTKLALADTPYVGLADLLTGPTGIAYSDLPSAAHRVLAAASPATLEPRQMTIAKAKVLSAESGF